MRAHRAFTLVICLGGIKWFEKLTDEKKKSHNIDKITYRNEKKLEKIVIITIG